MSYQIFFTETIGSTLPANTEFLRVFLTSIQTGLSSDATVETKLRKPLSQEPSAPWLFCFGKEGVLYQIENDTQIKVFLVITSHREGGFIESDLVELIEAIQTQSQMMQQIEEYRKKPIAKSLEEAKKQWLPNEQEKQRWAKAKLDLMVECGPQSEAQQVCQYFDNRILDLVDQAQYRCRSQVLQDGEQNWWCWVRPVLASAVPKIEFHINELQHLLYDSLRSAPAFRYAFSIVGGYEYLFTGESPETGTYRQVSQGNLPLFTIHEGIVLSEVVLNTMKAPPKRIELFKQGYSWIPVKALRVIGATTFKPVLDPDPQSAEEYYNNGSILGHSGQHREALIAFEMALLLKPNFHLAMVARDTARRYLE